MIHDAHKPPSSANSDVSSGATCRGLIVGLHPYFVTCMRAEYPEVARARLSFGMCDKHETLISHTGIYSGMMNDKVAYFNKWLYVRACIIKVQCQNM